MLNLHADVRLVHSVVLPGTAAAAEDATGDEELAASAAVAGPGSGCVGLLWQEQLHLQAPLPEPAGARRAGPSPLAAPVVKAPLGGPLWGGHPGTSCQATGEEECADLQRSVLEVLWMGHTAAGSASALQSGPPGE